MSECGLSLCLRGAHGRLLDIAAHYYDLTNFPQCEARRVLERLLLRRDRERRDGSGAK